MKNYEVNFIVDPVLSGEEIKATAQTYVDHLKNEGCTIVHVDEMGLRQLAYPINKRTSGVYYCIEFEAPNGELVDPMELSLRRDERIIRFLTVALDKHGVKYNADKRAGKIGKVTKKKKKEDRDNRDRRQNKKRSDKGDDKKAAKEEKKEEAKSEEKAE
ncbi:MAG TPA: 30S ribosomal protein S6 [Phaeodactylibacter sp.]|nr:30S ribosomal protein S6 [Phaeodactylibacter sp.]